MRREGSRHWLKGVGDSSLSFLAVALRYAGCLGDDILIHYPLV